MDVEQLEELDGSEDRTLSGEQPRRIQEPAVGLGAHGDYLEDYLEATRAP